METRSYKKKRLMIAKQAKVYRYTGEDRISELSDDVLHRILSLLPIKTIARMSVLSKRWKLIWSSFPNLDFSSMSHFVAPKNARKGNVFDFLYHVLHSHDKSSDIKALRFSAELSFTRLNRLIKQAVRLNVQELDLDIKTDDYFNLTRSVITCKSLRILKLKSQTTGFRLPPSSTMKDGFQALHTLSLSQIIFYEQSSLLDLFTETSFPHLTKLELVNCLGLKSLRIACRQITDLTLEECRELKGLSIYSEKLEMLRVKDCFDYDGDHSCVEIDAPIIKSFVWERNAIVESNFLEKMTCLDASIGFRRPDPDYLSVSKVSRVANFLCEVSSSQSLQLDKQCLKILATSNYTTSILPHSFDNLKVLEIHICSNNKQIPALASLLRISPSLHTLIINIHSESKIVSEWDKEKWDLVTSEAEVYWECKIQSLNTFVYNVKVVKINAHNECLLVFCLVKFLLKYGIYLDEITIPHKSSKANLNFKSHLLAFPWASSTANIIFRKS